VRFFAHPRDAGSPLVDPFVPLCRFFERLWSTAERVFDPLWSRMARLVLVLC
jgi:hypothetical protein